MHVLHISLFSTDVYMSTGDPCDVSFGIQLKYPAGFYFYLDPGISATSDCPLAPDHLVDLTVAKPFFHCGVIINLIIKFKFKESLKFKL